MIDVAAGQRPDVAVDRRQPGPARPCRGPSQGGLGATGYHVALGQSGDMSRTIDGLDAGRDYRISLRYARDSRSAAGAGAANAQIAIGSLDTTLTAGTDLPSQGNGLE